MACLCNQAAAQIWLYAHSPNAVDGSGSVCHGPHQPIIATPAGTPVPLMPGGLLGKFHTHADFDALLAEELVIP